jgi:hypothetical protein
MRFDCLDSAIQGRMRREQLQDFIPMCRSLNMTVEINQSLSRSSWIFRESNTRGICSELKTA